MLCVCVNRFYDCLLCQFDTEHPDFNQIKSMYCDIANILTLIPSCAQFHPLPSFLSLQIKSSKDYGHVTMSPGCILFSSCFVLLKQNFIFHTSVLDDLGLKQMT